MKAPLLAALAVMNPVDLSAVGNQIEAEIEEAAE